MRLLMISAAIVVSGVVPFSAQAATITPPDNTVAISEATYYALKKAHCYIENAPATAIKLSNGVKCDPLIAKYYGKTVMRVQERGQMYTINTGDGHGPLLKTYTQGIYRVSGKYYYVKDGRYTKLSTTRPDKSIFNLVRGQSVSKTKAVQLISSDDFNFLLGRGGSAAEAARAKRIQQSYKGYFVIVTDNHSKLYYIPTNVEDGANPVRINGKLRDDIKYVSNDMSEKALSEMIQE